MKALRHDFLRSRPTLPPLARLLLLAGLAALVAVLHDYNTRSERIEALAAQTEQLHKALRRPPAGAGSNAQGAQDQQANSVVNNEALAAAARLSVRWGSLLDAIEQAQADNAQLLSLEPDAVRGRVRLSGEARSIDAIAAYATRLAEQDALSEVRLASEQRRAEGGAQAVEFSLDARWQSQAQGGAAHAL